MAEPTPIVILSAPGIQRDGTTLDGKAWSDGQWVRFDRERPRKIRGYRFLTDRVSEVSRGLHSFSRNGVTYLHTGGMGTLEQVVYSNAGVFSTLNSRTPSLVVSAAANAWQFDTIYDPIVNNAAMLVAHCAPGLIQIDASTEAPVYWGTMDGTTALTPLGMPAQTTSLAVTSVTGTTSSGSAVVSSVSSTTALVFGMTVTGTGVPANTYIKSIDSSSQITLSQNATATNAGVTLTVTTGGVSGGVVCLHPYLVTFGSSGYVQWSTPLAKGNTPADFWSTGSGSAYVTDQKIVRGMVLRGGPGYSPAGLLWSLNALVRMTFVGGSPVFSFDTISDTITIMAPNAVTELDGVYYWAGIDRFYMFGGTVREIPNTMNASFFFDGINPAYKNKTFCFRNTRWGEIWWCFPKGDATECNHAVIYNTRSNCWYDTPLPNGGRSAAMSPSGSFPYPVMTGVDLGSAPNLYTLWQHELGTDEVNRTGSLAIRSYVESNNFTVLIGQKPQEKAGLHVARVEPDIEQTGDMSLVITGSANAKAASVDSQPMPIKAVPTDSSQQVIPLKEGRRLLRFRFESNVQGGDYFLGQSLAFVEPANAAYLGAVTASTEPAP